MLGDSVRRFGFDRAFARHSPSLINTGVSAGRRRFSKRRVFLLGFVAVRGVVSLAMALAIPLTTHGRRNGVTGELLPCRRLKLG
jgi:NhaP-type Na+/H+ or K+/H+ antiporter